MAAEPASPLGPGLASAVLVLAIDEPRGGRIAPSGLEASLAGAILLELVDRGCLSEEDGRLVPTAFAEPDDELHAESLAVLRGSLRPRDARWWIERLPRELAPLRERVARPLMERGIVPHERTRFSGPYGGMRFPERDPEPGRRLRARLAEVLLGEREPTCGEAVLIGLIRPHGLERGLVPAERAGDAGRRAEEIAERLRGGRGAAATVLAELQRALAPAPAGA